MVWQMGCRSEIRWHAYKQFSRGRGCDENLRCFNCASANILLAILCYILCSTSARWYSLQKLNHSRLMGVWWGDNMALFQLDTSYGLKGFLFRLRSCFCLLWWPVEGKCPLGGEISVHVTKSQNLGLSL